MSVTVLLFIKFIFNFSESLITIHRLLHIHHRDKSLLLQLRLKISSSLIETLKLSKQ